MSSIGLNCIKKRWRPDLSVATDGELEQILLEHDADWFTPEKTRNENINRIFELWAEQEIQDQLNNPINCTICYENLSNGNNMTFPCGHQFHSLCVIRAVSIRCSEKCITKLNDKDAPNIELDYFCAQCNVKMDSYSIDKSTINDIQ